MNKSIHPILVAVFGLAILGNAREMPSRSDTLEFNHEVKIVLTDQTVAKGVMKYLVADTLIMETGRKIPVAQVSRIRVYRHILGKTIAISGLVGFCAGVIVSAGSDHRSGADNDFVGGVIFAIPCAAAGLVLSPLVMPFFKSSFRINGQSTRAQRMVKHLGKGNGSEW